MSNIIGDAEIRLNGTVYPSKSATLKTGGKFASGHDGGGVRHGLSLKYTGPSIDLTFAARSDIDVLNINNGNDITIVFNGNNGQRYMLTGCAPSGEGYSLNDTGEISGSHEAVTCVGL